MKKLILFFLFILFVNVGFSAEKIKVYVFTKRNCSHCNDEKEFLNKIKPKYSHIQILYLDAVSNKKNKQLYHEVVKKFNIQMIGFPTTIIGKTYFIGFADEETTGKEIEKVIINAKKNKPKDIIEQILKDNDHKNSLNSKSPIPEKVKVPIFGEIYIKNLSLPILTILFGALDGFNPCAIWALIMLLSFLIVMKDRKKMFLLGSVFILVSAFIYFLFMVTWLNLFIFFSYFKWIRLTIGIVAIGGGLFYLKEYFCNKENACKVTSGKFKQKVSQKMLLLTENNKLYLAVIGISLLAILVNMIDLLCSVGLPVVYTQILSLSSLTSVQYYSYITLYIFVFLLNDLIIFSIAFFSLQLIKLTTKYFRYFHLIGGAILIILGALLIFKPEYLSF